MLPRLSLVLLSLSLPLGAQGSSGKKAHTFRHENVLGTSLTLKVVVPSAAAAKKAEAVVLAEIERLRLVFSGWDDKSELSRLQRNPGKPQPISMELAELFIEAAAWQRKTKGAFHMGTGALTALWKKAVSDKKLPDEAELAAATKATQAFDVEVEVKTNSVAATFPAGRRASLDGIAKGRILDAACKVALARTAAVGVVLDIGGDIRIRGRVTEEIDVANPKENGEGARPVSTVKLRKAAIATSGGYARGFTIGDRTYSHILDPRTGKPVEHVLSATVVAPTGMQADALATALNVLSIEEGLELIEAAPKTEALVVGKDGKVHRSSGWKKLEKGTAVAANAKRRSNGWPNGYGLRVDFEINDPIRKDKTGRYVGYSRYRRPFIAIWVENEAGKSVRTLLLWYEGDKWLRDLRKWYRKSGRNTFLIHTTSRATRPPGKYHTVWYGMDDDARKVPPGTYTIYIEAAREHGTHKLLKKKIVIGTDGFRRKLKGNCEIKAATLTYGNSKARKKRL